MLQYTWNLKMREKIANNHDNRVAKNLYSSLSPMEEILEGMEITRYVKDTIEADVIIEITANTSINVPIAINLGMEYLFAGN